MHCSRQKENYHRGRYALTLRSSYRGPLRVVPAALAAILVALDLELELAVGHVHDIRTLNIRECLYAVKGLLARAKRSTGGGASGDARGVQAK